MALIDLRRLSLSNPSRYRRNAPRCATCSKQSSNGSSQRLNRSNHAGALRGSTREQRTEIEEEVQVLYLNLCQISA